MTSKNVWCDLTPIFLFFLSNFPQSFFKPNCICFFSFKISFFWGGVGKLGSFWVEIVWSTIYFKEWTSYRNFWRFLILDFFYSGAAEHFGLRWYGPLLNVGRWTSYRNFWRFLTSYFFYGRSVKTPPPGKIIRENFARIGDRTRDVEDWRQLTYQLDHQSYNYGGVLL